MSFSNFEFKRGDFVRLVISVGGLCPAGILSGGIMSGGDYVRGDFVLHPERVHVCRMATINHQSIIRFVLRHSTTVLMATRKY